MYHQMSSGVFGKVTEMEMDMNQKRKLHTLLTTRISNKVGTKAKELIAKSNKEKYDLYITGFEAKELGFATDVIKYKERGE